MHGRLLVSSRLPINPNAPEQCQSIGELQRVFVSGDWGRYAEFAYQR
jgi:hypothetical protein